MEEPARSLHDIVTIRNIDIEDFTFSYGQADQNTYPYTIKAGAIARFPRFLARHAMKHLIDQVLNRKGIKTNNEAARAELQEMIFIEEEVFQQAPQESEGDRQKREIERLNRPSDLEAVLARNRGKTKAANPEGRIILPGVKSVDVSGVAENKPEEEKFDGLNKKEKMAEKELDLIDDVKPATPAIKPKPTRAELFAWAKQQGLVLDHKDDKGKTLRSRLDNMKVDDIIKELDYPLK